jgi:Fe-S cluster assembly iron-binding protein IscA
MNISLFSFSFDPVTLTDLATRSVSAVLVRLVARGCEGTKVEVLENPPAELLTGSMEGTIESLPNVRIYMSEADASRLQGAKVIAAKGKWFLQSPNIQSRCGCGSSFSFEDKVVAFLSAAQTLADSSPLCQALGSSLGNHQND